MSNSPGATLTLLAPCSCLWFICQKQGLKLALTVCIWYRSRGQDGRHSATLCIRPQASPHYTNYQNTWPVVEIRRLGDGRWWEDCRLIAFKWVMANLIPQLPSPHRRSSARMLLFWYFSIHVTFIFRELLNYVYSDITHDDISYVQ